MNKLIPILLLSVFIAGCSYPTSKKEFGLACKYKIKYQESGKPEVIEPPFEWKSGEYIVVQFATTIMGYDYERYEDPIKCLTIPNSSYWYETIPEEEINDETIWVRVE